MDVHRTGGHPLDLDTDPLAGPASRDWAVRDYSTHLQAVLKRSPATVNNALAAGDDFYIRCGLGLSVKPPRGLGQRVGRGPITC